jgi:hypothetical protein
MRNTVGKGDLCRYHGVKNTGESQVRWNSDDGETTVMQGDRRHGVSGCAWFELGLRISLLGREQMHLGYDTVTCPCVCNPVRELSFADG